MEERKKNLIGDFDKILVLLYLILVFFGWFSIYAAVYNEHHKSIFDLSQSYGRQLVWIASSLVIALFILIIDVKLFTTLSYGFYVTSILLVISVLFIGKEVSGSKSWLGFGDFGIQPAEFAKIGVALAISRLLGDLNKNIRNNQIFLISIFIIALPISIIFLQNETGSALVFLSLLLVFYREGMSGTILWISIYAIIIFITTLIFNQWYIIISITIVFILLWFFIRKFRKELFILITIYILSIGFTVAVDYIFNNILQPHQKSRIEVLLGLNKDNKGAGYNVNQSKIAIGSGGFLGKGFLQGTQTKFKFVPEQSTDFIFCTVGEEWGFVGSFFLIIVYLSLIYRIIFLAENQRSTYSRVYGYSVASILFFHFAINIGMTLGLAPVIGIPLPYMSYGGSSLWAFTILLFIFIKLDINKKNIV